MSATAEDRDRATARALGTAGAGLVGIWSAVGVLTGAVRLVDAVHTRQALLGTRDASNLLSLSASLLLFMLWIAAFAAVGLGVAIAVAALVVDGRLRDGLLLGGVVTLCAVAQFVSERLSNRAWEMRPDGLSGIVTAAGMAVAPLVGLIAIGVVLGPLVRTPRSTAERAAAG